ncbi:hypothetical protein EXM22_13935 [Oceanispirochaeta crateris]|uniref:HD-GYP domain-containing protein n=1 Tax=Oceanispirochaeta crateris TaxID=2518645 RepID=A0A5C1QLQ1_9SPIO|nr:hypothetical protein [Oceanispirochaeta crateris]QEN09035.1 hypothetical protein EXM22_13935 [Oceanispirochaeta crateris]
MIDSLKNKLFALGSRIIAVADTFDAKTSHRAFSLEKSYEFAYNEIQASSGAQLCPEVYKSFLSLKDEIPILLEEDNNEIILRFTNRKIIKNH